MTNAQTRTIAAVAPTLAELKKLPIEEQALLLLDRLIVIYGQLQSSSGLNKRNLLLPGDPFGLGAGYAEPENLEIRKHLLGVPWTILVNHGCLVDPSGMGFYSVSDEGTDALRNARTTVGQNQSIEPAIWGGRVSDTTLLGGGMPRTAIVIHILIASPTDVSDERNIVTNAIHDWNAAHFNTTGIMLNPIRWESHSFPASGDRPQAIINEQIVDKGDFLIGIFGVRLGTPTGKAQSGTIEEIERFRKAGKQVALYFSTADVRRSADRDQLKALEDYQAARQKDTLYYPFSGFEELRRLVSHHLPMIVSRVCKELRLESVGEELRNAQSQPKQTLQEVTARAKQPLLVSTEFVGEYPDGPVLWVTVNRNIIVTHLDYLDERDVRIVSDPVHFEGMDFRIPIQYAELVKINNMKPRNGSEPIHMGFLLRIVDGDHQTKHKIPAALQPSFKPINNTSTAFFKLLG